MYQKCLEALAESLLAYRKEHGLTQFAAAEDADITYRIILDCENLHGNPRFDSLIKMIHTFKLDPVKIFFPEIEHGSPAMVKLQTALADCSDDEAEALYDVCIATLNSLRKAKIKNIEQT